MSEFRELTKAEDQIMRVVWELEKASVKEIVDRLPEPKPAYTTVATVLKVLKTKGFVDYALNGSQYTYFGRVTQVEYTQFAFRKVLSNYFSGSYKRLVSFLAEEKDLDKSTRDELTKLADQLNDK